MIQYKVSWLEYGERYYLLYSDIIKANSFIIYLKTNPYISHIVENISLTEVTK